MYQIPQLFPKQYVFLVNKIKSTNKFHVVNSVTSHFKFFRNVFNIRDYENSIMTIPQ